MTLTSWAFAPFLVAAVLLHWSCPRALRPWMLLGASAAFYVWADPDGLAVFGGLIAVVVLIAPRTVAGAPHSSRWLALGVSASLGTLLVVKYLPLFGLGAAVAGEGVLTPWTTAPLGISYSVLLLIHYLVETHRGGAAPGRPRDVMLFTSFFPTVVAGPLKRFEGFAPQIERVGGQTLQGEDLHAGLSRIVLGLFKKLVIADNAARFAGPVFTHSDHATWSQLWIAVYAYSVQIYFDFAGYSDLAIGSARLFGYRVPENFDRPYARTNIAEFWRHWHMTLTGWILQYVYIPLGGNRRGEARGGANRLAAMALCGLWHGASWNFAVWGVYHGLLLNGYRVWSRLQPKGRSSAAGRWAATALTFHLVAIGWVLFACDLGTAAKVLARLFLVSP
jgi:alginate O-acetyltransferase complex protein AlgI